MSCAWYSVVSSLASLAALSRLIDAARRSFALAASSVASAISTILATSTPRTTTRAPMPVFIRALFSPFAAVVAARMETDKALKDLTPASMAATPCVMAMALCSSFSIFTSSPTSTPKRESVPRAVCIAPDIPATTPLTLERRSPKSCELFATCSLISFS